MSIIKFNFKILERIRKRYQASDPDYLQLIVSDCRNAGDNNRYFRLGSKMNIIIITKRAITLSSPSHF